jgi:hypothetical protein
LGFLFLVLSMVHCSVPRVLCDPDFHPTHTRCTYARSPRLCFNRFCRASGVLGGLRLTLAFWRSRRKLIVETAFFDLHFPFVLAAQREPRPSSTMHLSGFRSPHCIFLYSLSLSLSLLGSALNLWESIYQHHSQFPSTSCQPYLTSTRYRDYLDILPLSIWHILTPCSILSMSNPPTSPTTPTRTRRNLKRKKEKNSEEH